eukprot:gene14008-18786_t
MLRSNQAFEAASRFLSGNRTAALRNCTRAATIAWPLAPFSLFSTNSALVHCDFNWSLQDDSHHHA